MKKEYAIDWQERERKRIERLDNYYLYHETIDLAGGDDWDGEFTNKGKITFDLLKTELELRLRDWFGDKI